MGNAQPGACLARVMRFEMECNPPGSALWRADTALRVLPRRPAWAAAHALSRRGTGRFAPTPKDITRARAGIGSLRTGGRSARPRYSRIRSLPTTIGPA
ncbi:hypothetical protein XFF6992_220137 [Xanthomonas citri pv. fuscans]|nr:hypothetical protein XFF6992_220137 [Xanthomonas citri pv. fuscans]